LRNRIFGIILFLSLITPVAVTYLYLHYQKNAVRKAVKHQLIEGLDRDELVLLRFSAGEIQTQLRWKHDREFTYRGEMYDIVEREARGDSLYFWCWWDHEETLLDRQLNDLLRGVNGKDPCQRSSRQQLQQFFLTLYCAELPGSSAPAYGKPEPGNHFLFAFYNRMLTPPKPPPRLRLS
jgi:hypothetical protein